MIRFAYPLRVAPFTAMSAALLLLGACGGPADPQDDPVAVADDPPGAALPLSIGGRVSSQGDDEMAIAVNCAAALELTADRLASMSGNPSSAEIALIGRAKTFFVAEAEKATEADDTSVGSVNAQIGRRRSEKADEVTEQAQLAIACLRRFGDSVDPQTGIAR